MNSQNDLLLEAIKKRDINTARNLIHDYKITPNFNNNQPIIEASKSCNANMVRLLLTYPSVDPSDRNYKALKIAYTKCNLDITRLFIKAMIDNPAISMLSLFLEAPLDISYGLIYTATTELVKSKNYSLLRELLQLPIPLHGDLPLDSFVKLLLSKENAENIVIIMRSLPNIPILLSLALKNGRLDVVEEYSPYATQESKDLLIMGVKWSDDVARLINILNLNPSAQAFIKIFKDSNHTDPNFIMFVALLIFSGVDDSEPNEDGQYWYDLVDEREVYAILNHLHNIHTLKRAKGSDEDVSYDAISDVSLSDVYRSMKDQHYEKKLAEQKQNEMKEKTFVLRTKNELQKKARQIRKKSIKRL